VEPAIARVSAGKSRLSPAIIRNPLCRAAASKNFSWPVEKSSQPTTVFPSASNRSTSVLPMNPAAPVTKILFM